MTSRGSTTLAPASESPASRLATLPETTPELTLGWSAAQWVETNLVQLVGPRAGQAFRLTRDQLRFLLHWYALDDSGRWLYSHGARRLAKGSGKSPFAAVLALTEFLAPVRLERFDDRVPGGVRGRPVAMPLVQIAATTEAQTANTMRMVRAFTHGSDLAERYGLDIGKTRFYRLPEGTLEVITSSSTAAEGAEASFVVADETEHWRPSNGGVELAATLGDNLAKSGARMLETSNAWVPGVESVAETTYAAWLAQEEGRTRGRRRILYDARIAPPDTDLTSYESLERALRFVYADCEWKAPRPGEPVDVVDQLEAVWSPRTRPDDAKRKYLNWPTVAQDAWIAPEEWSVLARPDEVVGADEPVVLFFDGSKSRDATALVGCRIEDGFVFTLGVWEPDPYDPDETVDAADVDRVVRRAFDELSVVAFFADVREWESFALTAWPERYRDRLRVWAAPNARPPQAVAWDMRGHGYEFARATEAAHAAIVGGEVRHDGDSRVARHVANARRRPYRDAVAIGKESPDSPRKIDAAVCVIGALMVRRLALGAGSRATARPTRVVVLS